MKKSDKNKKKAILYTFLTSYGLYFLSLVFSQIQIPEIISTAFLYISLTLLLIILPTRIQTKKHMTLFVAIALVATIAYLALILDNSTKLLFMLLFAFCAKGLNSKQIIKTDIWLKTIIILEIFILSNLGIIDITTEYMRDGMIRHTLGFYHHNFAGQVLLTICLDIIYLRQNKKLTNLIIGLVFFVFINYYINSRAAAIGAILASTLQLIPIKKMISSKKKAWIFSGSLLIICTIISLHLAKSPDTVFYRKLDEILSGRIHLFRAFYNHYSIKILGNKFEYYGETGKGSYNNVLDNSYLYLLIHDGILIFAIFIIFYAKKLSESINQHKNETWAILVASTLVGIMGRTMFSPIGNPQLMLCDDKKIEE